MSMDVKKIEECRNTSSNEAYLPDYPINHQDYEIARQTLERDMRGNNGVLKKLETKYRSFGNNDFADLLKKLRELNLNDEKTKKQFASKLDQLSENVISDQCPGDKQLQADLLNQINYLINNVGGEFIIFEDEKLSLSTIRRVLTSSFSPVRIRLQYLYEIDKKGLSLFTTHDANDDSSKRSKDQFDDGTQAADARRVVEPSKPVRLSTTFANHLGGIKRIANEVLGDAEVARRELDAQIEIDSAGADKAETTTVASKESE